MPTETSPSSLDEAPDRQPELAASIGLLRDALSGGRGIVAVVGLAALLSAGLISLWCVWAAISSIIVVRHIREQSAKRYADRSVAPVSG